MADVLVESGIGTLADSRIQNIVKMKKAGVQAQFVLLRTPAPSQAQSVVEHADVSLNTEMAVIERLSSIRQPKGPDRVSSYHQSGSDWHS